MDLDIDTLRVYHNYYVLSRPNARNVYWAIPLSNKVVDRNLNILKNLIAAGQLSITVECK